MTVKFLNVTKRYSELLVTAIETCEGSRKAKSQHMGELTILDSKLSTLTELFEFAISMDENDLLCLQQDHPRWEAIKTHVKVHTFDQPALLQQHIQGVTYLIASGFAYISKAFERTGKTARRLVMGLGAVYYMAAKKKALRQARISLAKPDILLTKLAMDQLDSKLMASITEKAFTKIHTHKVIFVPRVSLNDLNPGSVIQPQVSESDQFNPNFTLDIGENEDRIKIRVLAPFSIPALDPDISTVGCFGGAPRPEHTDLVRGVVYHIHGGGFVGMSSRSHQSYTRQWANQLQTVVFSVDYRLAPEHPFPAGLEDVWAGYLWVAGFAKQCIGIEPDGIAVTGDSAGGNLACGVINKAIESGVLRLIPRGGLLSYPALWMYWDRYTPSNEFMLEDFIVHHTTARLIIQCYLASPAIDPKTDYYASPLLTPEVNLRTFPPIRLIIGNTDPLLDDCYRFIERLIGAGGDLQMTLFEGLPHAFLGFDLKFNGVPEAHAAIEEGGRYLQELLRLRPL
jgi:hormone-sensitive lipase